MTKILKKIFGYWEVWHIVLATWLYLFFFLYVYDGHKQLTLLTVMGIAIVWEYLIEFLWETYKKFESYNGNRKAFFLNSLKDLLAALVSCLVCTGLL